MRILLLIAFCCGVLKSNAEQQSDTTYLVDSLNELAFNQKRADISQAMNNLILAQNKAQLINYQKGLAIAYLYEGGIYQQQGFNKRALSDFYLALDIFKRLKDTFNIAKVNQQIANSLLTEGKIEDAASVFEESLNIYVKNDKQEEVVNVKNSLGLVQLKKGEINSAHQLFKEALQTSQLIHYLYGEKKALYHLGLTALSNNLLDSAEQFFYAAFTIDQNLNDYYGQASNRIQLAGIALRKNQLDKALNLSIKSYKEAKSINAFNLVNTSIEQIISNYRLQGNYKNAMIWQDTAIIALNNHRKQENEYAANFIDIIKSQQSLRLDKDNIILRAEKASDEHVFILTVGTFILIILAVLVVMVFINYQKQKHFSRELRAKNILIEAQIVEMGTLNKEISEQNKLLETDNKTKDKLLSIISHDLRNPLVNTKGILNLVNQGMVPEDQAKQLLVQLETQYMGTTSLLDNLLFWLKGQMAGKNLEKTKVSIFQLVRGLEEEHKMLLLRKNIVLNNTVDPQLQVIADKEMIRIVLRNLISNAIKFTPENGVISVAAEQQNSASVLTVTDSGIGMTDVTIQKINAKQYYTTAGTAMEKGSGFGLMLCSDLINRHRGKLVISSETGIGSTFTITLPT